MNSLSLRGLLAASAIAVSLAPTATSQCGPVQPLIPPGIGSQSNYGEGVAVAGDVAVIGAPDGNDLLTFQGAAYVWRHDGVQWNQEQKLTAFDAAQFDSYGEEVVASPNWIAVGSPHDDDLGSGSGAVYVYAHDGAAWNLDRKLLRPNGTANENYGDSMSMDGDVLVVDNSPLGVDVWRHESGILGWQLEQTLPGGKSVFGESVSVGGNVIVIGDNTATSQFPNEGVARVYEHDGSQWNFVATLTASDADSSERFGWSVATDGTEIAVGADRDDSLGSVYVFEKLNGTWTETARLRNSQGSSKFGDEVALQNGTLLAGVEAGSRVFEFRKVRGVWTEAIVHDQAGAVDLGMSIDLDGGRAIIGAHRNEEAFEFAVGELRLAISPTSASVGDPVTMETFCGPPGNLVGLIAVQVNGTPIFTPLVFFVFAPDSKLSISGATPAGLSGNSVGFMALGAGPGGKATASAIQTISFL